MTYLGRFLPTIAAVVVTGRLSLLDQTPGPQPQQVKPPVVAPTVLAPGGHSQPVKPPEPSNAKQHPSRYPRFLPLPKRENQIKTETGGIRALVEDGCAALGLQFANDSCQGIAPVPTSAGGAPSTGSDAWILSLARFQNKLPDHPDEWVFVYRCRRASSKVRLSLRAHKPGTAQAVLDRVLGCPATAGSQTRFDWRPSPDQVALLQGDSVAHVLMQELEEAPEGKVKDWGYISPLVFGLDGPAPATHTVVPKAPQAGASPDSPPRGHCLYVSVPSQSTFLPGGSLNPVGFGLTTEAEIFLLPAAGNGCDPASRPDENTPWIQVLLEQGQ